jgi:Copper amine oxidase, enzyme domain
MSESGFVSWPSAQTPLWQFSYNLADAPDAEGIAITSARFRGRQVLYKGSLPSLRVQYDNTCGPYKDPLNYNNAHPISGSNKVKVYTVWSSGLLGVAVEAFHTIGSYKLTERWTFWADGRITPRLYSAGLQCNINHRHHPYWRFDFDIEGAPNDTVFEYNTTTPDLGWGPGWHVKHNEITRVKNPATWRSWAVMDIGTTRGYHIIPGSNDGTADAFAPRDLFVMRYHGAEDKHGQQGNAFDDGLAAYINGEVVEKSDVVIWYCAHLGHHAEPEHADEYHACGPTLIPFRWT